MNLISFFVIFASLQSLSIAVKPAMAELLVTSPNQNVAVHISLDRPRIRFRVSSGRTTVIDWSPLVFTVDGTDLTDVMELAGDPEFYESNTTYPTRGVHSTAVDHHKGMRLKLRQRGGEGIVTLETRAFDDGVAFRFIARGPEGKLRTPDERTVFEIPAGAIVWHANLRGHYEGDYHQDEVTKIPAGEWVGPPMTFKLPDNEGYASITEAALFDYSGMALECNGKCGFVVGLAHRQPVSHPFELRYSQADIERLSHPAKVEGTITTPWRVVLVGDLNSLVNNYVITDLCPPPDPRLFPEGVNTPWVKPGRAVWRYLDDEGEPTTSPAAGNVIPRGAEATRGTSASKDVRGPSGRYRSLRDDIARRGSSDAQPPTTRRSRHSVTPEIAEWYSHQAGKLGFEYNVLEGYWRRWSDDQLREVADDARDQHVKLFVWLNSKDLHDAEDRRKRFDHLRDLGVAGLKIDFFDHEHKEMIDLYESIRRETAQRHLLVNFHGANKPTGEERTWPNELNREAIHGMESRSIKDRATHDTTLPFTRFLAGSADYTPVLFTARRANTTITHQIATACLFTETLLTYASNPQKLLDSPAVEMIKSIPATWDQTIVLPGSQIGQCAVYARRSGKTWYLAVLNGTEPRTLELSLKFLGDDIGSYGALLVEDVPGSSAAVKVKTIPATQLKGSLQLEPGGGFIARITPRMGKE